ncbi:MAG: serine/threonine protein kinase [Verrucomicrobiae bacterium]|nr:serine/threonine protein kinase [Verrucomicrobiae bacterium]
MGSPTGTSEIPSLQRIAAAFPHLEIVGLIGRGGMGFVFKARQPHLDRWVALKLLPDKLARDPYFAERFNREGRVLAKLNHPNIVSVYDFGKTEEFYYLLMEYVDGVNLRQAMQTGRFSPTEALAIVPKICEALQYAHEQGVLHRDIKPENILLDARGRVKIADFGIAKVVGEERPPLTLTGTGATLGTPHYMAPEQLESPNQVDHRADIYSLGVVFYEMLTGELPIGRFAPPSARTPVSSSVDEVVFRTLEKDRERRFQSALEVKTKVELLTASGSASVAARPLPVLLRETRGYISTLAHIQSLAGRVCSAHLGTGQWKLYSDRLVYVEGPQSLALALDSIRSITLGHFPAWVKPAGRAFLAISFLQAGEVRTLLFAPILPGTATVEAVNRHTAEWQQALREAIHQAIGLPLSESSPATFPLPASRLDGKHLWLLGLLGMVSALPVFFQSWLKGRPPGGYLEDLLPYLLALVPGVLWASWLFWSRRKTRRALFPPSSPPANRGPAGTQVLDSSKVSVKAIISAALTGLAWVLAGAPLVLAFAGGGLGWAELLLFGVPACLAGLAGSILGWVALGDMRYSQGRLRGLPLAIYGALGSPLLLLLVLAIGFPFVNVIAGQPSLALRMLAWLLPAGALTFVFWAIYATSRWASHAPRERRRGVLKWVCGALIMIGLVILAPVFFYLSRKTSQAGYGYASLLQSNPLPPGMVKLAALSDQRGDGYWWQPDGSQVDKTPSVAMKAEPNWRNSQPDERRVQMLLELHGVQTGDSSPRLILPEAHGWSGQTVQNPSAGEGSTTFYLLSAAFPTEKKTTTIYVGLARGPWRTLAQDAITASSAYAVALDKTNWKIAFHGATEEKEGHTVVQASYACRDRDFFEIRISAILANGTKEAGLVLRESGGHLRATFPKRALRDIQNFIFEVRPYQWTAFKEVHLWPAPAQQHASRANLVGFAVVKVPKSQVAVVTLIRGTNAIPEVGGFLVAPDDENISAEVKLEPATDAEGRGDPAEFTMNLRTAEGQEVTAGTTRLENAQLLAIGPPPLRLPLPQPGQDAVKVPWLQLRVGEKAETIYIQVAYTHRFRHLAVSASPIVGGGTNWQEALELVSAAAARDGETALVVRFTITEVAVVEEANQPWLRIDYVANLNTNWLSLVRAQGDGFETEVRRLALREGVAGLASVRHERALIRLPAGLSVSAAAELAQSLAVALVAQNLEVPPGREIPLFRVPVVEAGMLEVALGAAPVTQVPSTSLTFTGVAMWQEGRHFCLGFDYTLNSGRAQEVFRLQSPVPDAWVTSASTKFVRHERADAPPLVTYRATLALPPAVDETEARQMQQTNRLGWVGRTLELRAGERQALFSWALKQGAVLHLTVESRMPSVDRSR